MIDKTLYRYLRGDGGFTLSPNKPGDDILYEESHRLIAEEGMVLRNKNTGNITPCVDTDEIDIWEEVEVPDENVEI